MKLRDPDLLRTRCLIDGEWVDAASGATHAVRNPASGETLGTVPDLGVAETRRAIEAAARAFPAWAARTAKERAVILRRWYELLMANQDDLATLMTAEQGKPLAESQGEIAYAASFIEWFAEEGKRVYGDVIPGHQADKRLLVLRQPVGVVAAITPWNFPLAMITRKAGPALAAGCTFVCKPASQTPYSALAVAELAQRAGVPPGVLNVVTGDAAVIGGELTSNAMVRKITFTGSTAVGKKLMAQCAGTVKKLSLELGRQCALHRVRRCRPRCGRGRRHRQQVPQHRPDLRVRQPPAGAGRGLRGLHHASWSMAVSQAARRRWPARVRPTRARSSMPRRSPRSRSTSRTRSPRARASRSAASATRSAARSSSPPSSPSVTPDMLVAREETFGPVAPLFRFETEARGDRAWPTTPNSAWRPTSTRATWRAPGASPRRSNTASSGSTPA